MSEELEGVGGGVKIYMINTRRMKLSELMKNGKISRKKREEEKRKSPFLNTKACVTRSVCDG